jgi:hypothetical protein
MEHADDVVCRSGTLCEQRSDCDIVDATESCGVVDLGVELGVAFSQPREYDPSLANGLGSESERQGKLDDLAYESVVTLYGYKFRYCA